MSVVEHLDRYLGPIAEGWSLRDSDTGIQVVRFVDKPDPRRVDAYYAGPESAHACHATRLLSLRWRLQRWAGPVDVRAGTKQQPRTSKRSNDGRDQRNRT